MDIAQLLEAALLSPDATKRAEAEHLLNEAAENHFVEYITFLVDALANPTIKPEVRVLAGLGLKNQLTSKDDRKRAEQQARWISLDDATKTKIKETAVAALLSNDDKIASAVPQLVAAIATIELPRNEWPTLIPTIIENTKADKPLTVKRTSLLTIGYVCESADPTNPAIIAQANGILIAIVQGVQAQETLPAVRLTALDALVNSLEFIKYNFQREGERNYIMQVVCEATQANSPELQAAAFGCLARIMQLYYSYMLVYMEKALYGLTLLGMQSPDDRVACMAIEFWSTVCDEEFEIALNRQEDQERGLEPNPELVLYNFTLVATGDVLPALLNLLTKQNEDPEDDDWLVAMAAGLCLQLFALNVGLYVVEPTLTFVAAHISNDNWRSREAAVMAFGSILEGPEPENLAPLIREALSPILLLIKDEYLQVKETVAWCLGRIAELVVDAISVDEHLPNFLEALVLGLKDHPKVSTNCCWTLINLLEQYSADAPSQETSVLLQYYATIVPVLVELSGKQDNEYSLRASAYEALSAFVTYSAADTMPVIQSIAGEVLARLETTITMQLQVYNSETRTNLEELQVSILSLLTNIIRRLSLGVQLAADSLVTLFLKLLSAQEPNALIEEDIFIALSAVALALGPGFNVYMPALVPFLVKALTNTEQAICNTAVGVVADLAQSLGGDISPHLTEIMNILGANLNNASVKKELRPMILSCFGDVATAVGADFLPYVEFVMNICGAAASITAENDTYEAGEYVNSVKEAVLECYVGVVNGMLDNPQVVYPYVAPIFALLEQIALDDSLFSSELVARAAAGLLGDLGAMFPKGEIKQGFVQPWVIQFIKQVRGENSFGQQTRDAARWARDQQKRQASLGA